MFYFFSDFFFLMCLIFHVNYNTVSHFIFQSVNLSITPKRVSNGVQKDCLRFTVDEFITTSLIEIYYFNKY